MTDTQTILPPNATRLERDLEAASTRSTGLAAANRPLWDPDACPGELLPWLALALSVDTWGDDWPEAVKRDVVREAVAVHRRKGTIGALKRAIAALGFPATVREWHEATPHGTPYTFSLNASANAAVASGIGAGKQAQDDLIDTVMAAKNARSHFDLTLEADFGSTLGLAAALSGTRRTAVRTGADNRNTVHGGLGLAGLMSRLKRSAARAAVKHRNTVAGSLGLAAAVGGHKHIHAHAAARNRNGVDGGLFLGADFRPASFIHVIAEVK